MDGSGKHLHNSNMSTRPGPTRLPTYQLYGDAGGSGVPERLHVETISSRSRLHDWEIAPHRHEVLFQILYIASGQAEAQVDGRRQRLRHLARVFAQLLRQAERDVALVVAEFGVLRRTDERIDLRAFGSDNPNEGGFDRGLYLLREALHGA